MEPTKQLIEELGREEIERAQRMTFAQKFWAGAELFDYACAISSAAIRRQHPDYDDAQVLAELRRRVDIAGRSQ